MHFHHNKDNKYRTVKDSCHRGGKGAALHGAIPGGGYGDAASRVGAARHGRDLSAGEDTENKFANVCTLVNMCKSNIDKYQLRSIRQTWYQSAQVRTDGRTKRRCKVAVECLYRNISSTVATIHTRWSRQQMHGGQTLRAVRHLKISWHA